jgi:peptidoglycan/LPS O-acetylase OafA/YrhL
VRIHWPRLRPESDSFLQLDALRVVATLCVVVFHWRLWLELDPTWQAISDRIELWAPLVDMFFVVSGVVICHVYVNRMGSFAQYGDFLRKRLARLAPMHWATLAFSGAAAIAAPLLGHAFSNPEAYASECLVQNMALLHAYATCANLSFNYPSWSISAEAGCYVLFPIILLLYRIRVWAPALLSAIMIAVLSLAGPFSPDGVYWYNFDYYWGALRGLPAFAFGVSLYGLRSYLRIPYAGPTFWIGFVLFLIMGQFGVDQWFALGWAYAICAVAVAADTHGKAGAFSRTLAPFAALTYPVYMLHLPVGATLIQIGARGVFDASPVALAVATLAAIPILVGVAYIAYALYELPARRWLSGARPHKKQASAEREASASNPAASLHP